MLDFIGGFDEMAQHTLKNVNNFWNTNISLYLETSGGQNSNLYLKVVRFKKTVLIKHLQLVLFRSSNFSHFDSIKLIQF